MRNSRQSVHESMFVRVNIIANRYRRKMTGYDTGYAMYQEAFGEVNAGFLDLSDAYIKSTTG